ncbi:MAG: DUF3102 domain-containing protein [Oscillospiraceae bacterium]|nr:DUF3102 domain-containing protein [Oscillospiraceae bacterium]
MNDLANTETHLPSRLDDLENQAHMFVQSAAFNLLQLGRVLTEAKPLVPHGEWTEWVKKHAKMSVRTAQQYMQAFAEFGLNTRIAELGTSRVLKLLPMSEEDRRELLEENDVSAMTTRQLDEAIREQKERLRTEARAEVQAEIDAANEAREAAERRALEAENRPQEVPEELADQLRANDQTIREQRAEIDRLAGVGQEALDEKRRLIQENNNLRRDIKERDEDLEAMQADFNRTQEELLNLQSAQARGDAERQPADALTPDMFSMAVNTFIGACCRLPHMGRAFRDMSVEEKDSYDQSLRAVEEWAEGARQALNSIEYREAIFID